MSLSYSDIIITAIVLAAVVFAVFRNGQVNPIGTGRLARRLSAVEAKVAAQDAKLTSLDEGQKVIADSVAQAAREVAAFRIEAAGDRGLNERTWATVSRIEGFFIQDSFERRREQ